MPDLLPSSVCREIKNVIFRDGVPWVPIHCANCGCDGGHVPEASKQFAFYLCDPCAATWSPLAGTMMVSDEVFWQTVREEQIDRYGRELTTQELADVLSNPNSSLSKLNRSR